MKHRLLRLGLRGIVVGSALIVGCSQGHCPCTPGPVPVAAAPLPVESPRTPRAVARREAPRPPHAPEVKVLEVLPADSAIAEHEITAGLPPSDPVRPVVVRAARDEGVTEEAPYGHAADYRWLTGELRYSPARGAWCLHYAAEAEEDRHGGSVTLVGAGPLTELRPGQAVRVEGEMIDPDTREPSTAYRVHSLRPLP